MKNVLKFVDEFETAQTISIKKRGHFNDFSKTKKDGSHKKLPKIIKSYKSRRTAIKRGDFGPQSKYGRVGCSSYWW